MKKNIKVFKYDDRDTNFFNNVNCLHAIPSNAWNQTSTLLKQKDPLIDRDAVIEFTLKHKKCIIGVMPGDIGLKVDIYVNNTLYIKGQDASKSITLEFQDIITRKISIKNPQGGIWNLSFNLDYVEIFAEVSDDIKDFPIKVGDIENVETYAATLINGEEQLLITRTGEQFLTKGDGTYVSVGGSADVDLSNYYNKEEVDTIVSSIEPPAGSTHIHDNTEILAHLGDSAGMLSYNGKVVVNSKEYSFRSLPLRKPKSKLTKQEMERRKLPWLI